MVETGNVQDEKLHTEVTPVKMTALPLHVCSLMGVCLRPCVCVCVRDIIRHRGRRQQDSWTPSVLLKNLPPFPPTEPLLAVSELGVAPTTSSRCHVTSEASKWRWPGPGRRCSNPEWQRSLATPSIGSGPSLTRGRERWRFWLTFSICAKRKKTKRSRNHMTNSQKDWWCAEKEIKKSLKVPHGGNLHNSSNNTVQKKKKEKNERKPCSAAGLLEQSAVSRPKSSNIKHWGNCKTQAHWKLTFGRKATPGFPLRLEAWHCRPADRQTESRLPPPRRDQDLKQEGAPVLSCNQCRSCDEGRRVEALWDEQLKQWKGVEGFFWREF